MLEEKYKERICGWLEKSKTEEGGFNKFICLWISFNIYYSQFYNKDEKEAVFNSLENYSSDVFLEVLKSKELQVFFNHIKKNHQGGISYKTRGNNLKKEEYTDISSLKEFSYTVYRIRCNLFHGDKMLGESKDEKLTILAYDILYLFLTKMYVKEGII